MGSNFSWSAVASSALFAAISGVTIWWFIRRRRREMRFPMARILDLPRTRLPRLVLRQPPWVPFLLFAVCAIAFAVWTAQPRRIVFTAQEPRQTRVHILVDMSPSMSANGTVGDLAQKVRELWEQMGGAARMTFGTTHSDTIYDTQDVERVEEIIKGLGFHRGGVRMGNAVKAQMAQAGDLDRLFIVSDRDQYSWSGFQWQFLLDEVDVYHVNFGRDASPQSTNAFIQNVRLTSTPGSLSEDWEVEIAQGGASTAQEGTIRATWRGETLTSTSWVLTASRRNTTVLVSWPHTKTPLNVGDEPIVWEITVQGNDGIEMDNQFRTRLSSETGMVRVIAEPIGELALEDPVTHLMTSLKVSGLQAERFDSWTPLRKWENPGLGIMIGGLGRGVDTFCPNPNTKDTRGARTTKHDAKIWIAPWESVVNFGELCACVKRWGSSDLPNCGEITNRNDWIKWLTSAGGHQVGGDIGVSKQAVAFGFDGERGNADILAFTVPLKPSTEFGISHGDFPLMIHTLVGWHSSRQLHGVESASWPRIQDTASEVQEGMSPKDLEFARLTNIPVGESQLATLSTQQLPPAWYGEQSTVSSKGSSKRDAEDPLPWISALVAIAVATLVGEVFWHLRKWRKHRSSLARSGLAAVFIAAFCIGIANNCFAQIQIDFFNHPGSQSMVFRQLSREVNGRTSIDFMPKPLNMEAFDEVALEQPWLWLHSTERLTNPDGTMQSSLVQWVKRGGLIVIESIGDESKWDRFVQPLMRGTFKPTGWRAVPPDHELMRSFYLLETLPMCSGKVWRWFGMDGRLALVHIPFSLSSLLQDQPQKSTCEGVGTAEYQSRVFVNLMMVALTTDYKRDQIHLPEILKRLRSP